MNRLITWDLFLTGGEVFLYRGITHVLEHIPRMENLVKVYTNGTIFNRATLGNVNPKKVLFRCSYHPESGDVGQFIKNMELLDGLKIPFGVFMVAIPGSGVEEFKTGIFSEKGYEVRIDTDQRLMAHKQGKVECSVSTMVVGPDGTAFHCVSKMMRNKDRGPNLMDGGNIRTFKSKVVCDEPQACSPCDLAASVQEET